MFGKLSKAGKAYEVIKLEIIGRLNNLLKGNEMLWSRMNNLTAIFV